MSKVCADGAREHAITEIALPVMGFEATEERERPSGSAVLVAPNLAVTALHVIQDYRRFFEERELSLTSTGDMAFAVILHQYRDGRLFSWRAVRMRTAEPLDVALLELIPTHPLPRDFTWRLPKLQLTPPKVGVRVQAIGYPHSLIREHSNDKWWEQTPVVSTGIVREVHVRQRDAGMNRFPCFQTDARFDGGMSGGPVFTADKSLCGIVCSSLPPSDVADEHASYASLLWPLMGLYVSAEPGSVESTELVRFRDLVSDGRLFVRDPHVVTFDEQNGTVSLLTSG